MSNNQITSLLTTILFIMIGILFFLSFIFVVLKIKEKSREKSNKEADPLSKTNNKAEVSTKQQIQYNKQSIFSFMKFDRIQDDMIVRKNGTKFVMVIECPGINYDLMSNVEKNSIEQGFIQFLNTLRHPIQIYVQTRTVNLTASIQGYKDRQKVIEDRLVSKQMEYNLKVNSGDYTEEQLEKERLEVIKDRNLYEYGRDIINNTERMNLNKNILRKHYYIILSYVPEEINNQNFDKTEIKDIAFSELYTKCRSVISSLSVCGINGKILNSKELAELLYISYNRDDADIYQLENALNARYDELYITAKDVLDKRMEVLDKKIEEDAVRKANEKLLEVAEENEKEREVRKKEEDLQNLINKMAKRIIDENKELVGTDVAQKAKEKIDAESKGKGGEKDEEEQKTSTRGRKRNLSSTRGS